MANCVLLTSRRKCFALSQTNTFSFSRSKLQVSPVRSLIHTFKRSLSNNAANLSARNTMEAWYINEYGSNDVLQHGRLPLPSLRTPTDILVRVHSASVNPIDYRMRSGYGESLLNLWRKLENVKEFPLVLGRDFSGEVVKTGRLARRFRKGDQVCWVKRIQIWAWLRLKETIFQHSFYNNWVISPMLIHWELWSIKVQTTEMKWKCSKLYTETNCLHGSTWVLNMLMSFLWLIRVQTIGIFFTLNPKRYLYGYIALLSQHPEFRLKSAFPPLSKTMSIIFHAFSYGSLPTPPPLEVLRMISQKQ